MHPASRIVKTITSNLILRRSICKAIGPLEDSFGRGHDYLRVSLTERCNLRCRYCMPEEGIELTKSHSTLALSETKHLIDLFVGSCGISKVRLTGGEPTIDSKFIPILEHLRALKGSNLKVVAMTTNGLKLKAKAEMYKNLGLDVVNISLDTLDPSKFERITRRPGWKLVFDGLMRALEVGFEKVKLNCVVIRGFNDHELVEFARLASKFPIEVRFIEFMPFMGNKWDRSKLVPFDEMLKSVRDEFPKLAAIESGPNETSKLYKQPDMLGCIGFISSLTNNFCSSCNRLRLTSDGNLKVCLFERHETSLRDLLRNGATDRELIRAVQCALSRKKKRHAAKRMIHNSVSRQSSTNDHNLGDESERVPPSEGREFSHLDGSTGEARMVNVGAKERVRRLAEARGEIFVGAHVLERILNGSLAAKGDILSVTKIAGIMGAKSTSQLIPLCHQIPLEHIQVDIEPHDLAPGTLIVRAKVEAEHKTGVEMECLSAVSIALLTLYDMCKSVGRDMVISNIHLVGKSKRKLTK